MASDVGGGEQLTGDPRTASQAVLGNFRGWRIHRRDGPPRVRDRRLAAARAGFGLTSQACCHRRVRCRSSQWMSRAAGSEQCGHFTMTHRCGSTVRAPRCRNCVSAWPRVGMATGRRGHGSAWRRVGVAAGRRGGGIGAVLLDELFVRCARKVDAICANVHARNPAQHLYDRKGFRVIGQGRGPLGVAMHKDLRRWPREGFNTSQIAILRRTQSAVEYAPAATGRSRPVKRGDRRSPGIASRRAMRRTPASQREPGPSAR
jgi:GNAT superfamily N-acetyltransferase